LAIVTACWTRRSRAALSSSPADEYPQAEVVALGALDLLELAEPPRHRERAALDQHRIGGIGAGLLGALQKVSEQVGRRMVHKRSRCVRWIGP
jgi:hypothetical protein